MINSEIKAAELTLRNVIAGMEAEKSSYSQFTEEVIFAKVDLLLHYV